MVEHRLALIILSLVLIGASEASPYLVINIALSSVRFMDWHDIYASRRSRTRDTVKLTVCVCNCSTVAMRRTSIGSYSHVLLDFWFVELQTKTLFSSYG